MGGNSKRNAVFGITNIVIAGATVGIFVMAILGKNLVERELNELQSQNLILENTMRQVYRPIGVANYLKDLEFQQIKVTYEPARPGKFSFRCRPLLFNKGKGILSYLGSFSYISKKQLNFRGAILAARLDTLVFDGMYSYARWTPILPDRYFEIGVGPFLNLDFQERYFLYTLFLYADQDGGLCDTERLDVLMFEGEPVNTPEGLQPKLAEGSYRTEKYHCYSLDEKQALLEMIDRFGHPLADVIRAGY